MEVQKKKTITLLVAAAVAMGGCANLKNGVNQVSSSLKNTFANEDPCSNNARNIGAVAGGIAAVIVAKQMGLDDKGALVAGGAGILIGAGIGASIDSRRCELHKIQQKYALQMSVLPIRVKEGEDSVGLSVQVGNQANKPQFAVGSYELSDDAKAAYQAMARQYSPKAVMGNDASASEAKKAASVRRVLVVGHTDDVGNSKQNAILSEKRAKAVAQIFADAGVPRSNIYYQGAGETMPIQSNDTQEGRAANRRVEIVDLSDKDKFDQFLASRTSRVSLYRNKDALAKKNVPSLHGVKGKPVLPGNVVGEKSTDGKLHDVSSGDLKSAVVHNRFDFGGQPVTKTNATLDIGDEEVARKTSIASILIGDVHADDMGAVMRCDQDRPRVILGVKSLENDKEYKTSDYIPGMYGNTWAGQVGDHLVVMNKVRVLRDGLVPQKPELKIYSAYFSDPKKNPKPAVRMNPEVNVYKGSKGLLYRVFSEDRNSFLCLDVMIPKSQPSKSNALNVGKVIYGAKGNELVADFKPVAM